MRLNWFLEKNIRVKIKPRFWFKMISSHCRRCDGSLFVNFCPYGNYSLFHLFNASSMPVNAPWKLLYFKFTTGPLSEFCFLSRYFFCICSSHVFICVLTLVVVNSFYGALFYNVIYWWYISFYWFNGWFLTISRADHRGILINEFISGHRH